MESSRARTPAITQSDSSDEEINVYLKVMKTVAVKVKKSDRIENLKGLLHEKEGIAGDIQDIFFAGDRLKDDHRLIDYGIKKDSTLHLILQNFVRMNLYVKIPSKQKTIVVEAMAHHTVRNIKSSIQVKEGILSDQFTLVYDGKLLEEDMTLASLNMKSESTVHLVCCPKHVLSISVKVPAGDVVKLKVEVLFTVHDVKAIVGSMIGVPVSDQILIYAGKELDDCKTLAFYDIKEECMLEMLPPSIQIFVQTPTEQIVKLKVNALFTVHDVKTIVGGMIGVSVSNNNVIYAGKRLEDQETLAFYGVKDKYILEILSPTFQIFIKTWSGKTITLDVQPCNTIKDVKRKLLDKLRIPLHLLSVLFAGKRLEEDFDLASYNIQKHSTLHMVLAPSSRIIEIKVTDIDPHFSDSTTISVLKRLAQTKLQAPVKELLFREVALKDERSLADYGIALRSRVTIVV